MCKVYDFPVKPQLSEEVKNRLEKNAKDYIKNVSETLKYINSVYGDSDDYEDIIVLAYDFIANAMDQAVNDIQ